MKTKLWNRNFIYAVTGMIISTMGGVGLNVALGVIVFQETKSTFLAAILIALAMVPQVLLPLVIGTFIDRRNPLKVLIGNEIILAGLFFLAGAIAYFYGFSYVLYLVFSLLISCFGVVSELASSSITPQIIAKENYVRGNAIINVIYPLCSVVFTPVAMMLYSKYGMPVLLFGYGIACLIDAAIESRIKADFAYIEADKTTIREYANDLKDALGYFRNDSGIRAVFLLFTFVMFSSCSFTVLIYPFFNTSTVLTNNDYALMISITSAGYLIGGFLHYLINIPDGKRYRIAVIAYFAFVVLEAPFFLMPFWLMCGIRFVLGILGMNSANIRISSIQAHVPELLRAKVNSLFAVLAGTATLLGQLVVGLLGEYLPYWIIQMGFQGFFLFGILYYVLPKKNRVRELYNYSTTEGS
jgi:MFS family permease